MSRKLSKEQRRLRRNLLTVLGSKEGRELIWWILRDLSHFFKAPLTGDNMTFHLEGARSVGVGLYAHMEQEAPELLSLMFQEQMEKLALAKSEERRGSRRDEEDDDG